jgi:hypothetical protein
VESISQAGSFFCFSFREWAEAVVRGVPRYDGNGFLVLSQQQPHGFDKAHAAYFHEKVDGIARLAGVGSDPSAVAHAFAGLWRTGLIVFYDEVAGFTHQTVVSVLQGQEWLTYGGEQGGEFALAGAADVRRVPAFKG